MTTTIDEMIERLGDRIMGKNKSQGRSDKDRTSELTDADAFEKVWDVKCEVCGCSPVVRATGLCGPCTWGEADTAGGNW